MVRRGHGGVDVGRPSEGELGGRAVGRGGEARQGGGAHGHGLHRVGEPRAAVPAQSHAVRSTVNARSDAPEEPTSDI